MRTYIVEFWDRGNPMHAPAAGIVVKTKRRIRQLVVDLHCRYWGGRSPTFWWGKDGFMAQSFDKSRGVEVMVQQVNHNDQSGNEMVRGVLAYKEMAS